jgi:hypothetical protein
MDSELQEFVEEGRKELRKAAGLLTPQEQVEDSHKLAIDELEVFMLRRLGVRLPILLNAKVVWAQKGPCDYLRGGRSCFQTAARTGRSVPAASEKAKASVR